MKRCEIIILWIGLAIYSYVVLVMTSHESNGFDDDIIISLNHALLWTLPLATFITIILAAIFITLRATVKQKK